MGLKGEMLGLRDCWDVCNNRCWGTYVLLALFQVAIGANGVRLRHVMMILAAANLGDIISELKYVTVNLRDVISI